MRIVRGKARTQACRKAFYPGRFNTSSSARVGPGAGWVSADDLYQLRHELRTPLTGMLGLAELLSAQDLPDPAALWLATLQACGQQMASLIDRTLRPEIQSAGKNYGTDTGIEGGGFLEQLICSHWPAARAGDTRLHLLVQPKARTYWRVDQVLLRQALDNLLANAIRFSPGGYIMLEASALPSGTGDGDTLLLVVENGGLGHGRPVDVKRASSMHIADCHFTASAADGFDYADRTYRMFSRGQGLEVVEQVCHTLNGQLQRSYTPVGGARFEMRLPAVVLRGEKKIKPFSPGLLRKSHCVLLLEEHTELVVSALLTGLGLSFRVSEGLDNAAFRALPEKQMLICNPSRLPASSSGMVKGLNPQSICIVAKLTHRGKSEWYVQPLGEPLLQAELQTALLRCLVFQGMAVCQAQELAE